MSGAGWKTWNGEAATREYLRGARVAIRFAGRVVLRQAKREVPFRDGRLSRSGVVLLGPRGVAEGCVSFGGGRGTRRHTVPYARMWHEKPARFGRGRKNRYLADPFNRLAGPTLKTAFAEEMARRTRSRLTVRVPS